MRTGNVTDRWSNAAKQSIEEIISVIASPCPPIPILKKVILKSTIAKTELRVDSRMMPAESAAQKLLVEQCDLNRHAHRFPTTTP